MEDTNLEDKNEWRRRTSKEDWCILGHLLGAMISLGYFVWLQYRCWGHVMTVDSDAATIIVGDGVTWTKLRTLYNEHKVSWIGNARLWNSVFRTRSADH
ncbi:hypothetical protein LXL04_014579 [Taraxacum kok-saghyz]